MFALRLKERITHNNFMPYPNENNKKVDIHD